MTETTDSKVDSPSIPLEVDGEVIELSPDSAEGKAVERLQDLDDPTKWVTVVEQGQEIEVERGLEQLRKRGYKVQIPSSNQLSSQE